MAEVRLPYGTVTIDIYETEESHMDNLLLSSFRKLFGEGKRTLWTQHYEGHSQKFLQEWELPFTDIEKCIEWYDCQKQFPKEYPPQIIVNFWFIWKGNVIGKRYVPEEYNGTDNGIMLFFSKTNTAIIQLNFPFDKVNSEFLAMREKILQLLPIELKENYFRLWLPTKKCDNYTIRRIKLSAS